MSELTRPVYFGMADVADALGKLSDDMTPKQREDRITAVRRLMRKHGAAFRFGGRWLTSLERLRDVGMGDLATRLSSRKLEDWLTPSRL